MCLCLDVLFVGCLEKFYLLFWEVAASLNLQKAMTWCPVCWFLCWLVDVLIWNDFCLVSGYFLGSRRSPSQQRNVCCTSIFTAMMVVVGTEETQTSSERSVAENSQSLHKSKWSVEEKPRSTYMINCISGLYNVSAWSKSRSLGFCCHAKSLKLCLHIFKLQCVYVQTACVIGSGSTS